FAPMPMWLRDPVWYVLTLAATAGAFKISEFVAGKAVATPLERAELSPNHTPKMIVMSVARDHCIERGWIDPYNCHVIVEDLRRESEVDYHVTLLAIGEGLRLQGEAPFAVQDVPS